MCNAVAYLERCWELMIIDALARQESCGGHFREEHQTGEGEAKRRDDAFTHTSVWEWTGDWRSNCCGHIAGTLT